LLAIVLLGRLDEAIQIFMSYRSADLADWELDMLTSLQCVVVLTLLRMLSTAVISG
jgi:VanZ family protein